MKGLKKMSRTKAYYEAVSSFRETLRAIEKEYQTGLLGIEKYKGSQAYAEESKRLENEKRVAIKTAQETAAQIFSEVLSEMREAAASRPMIAPTPEVLGILQALKMRSEISADELQQAARTVGDCQLALSVLDDIAHDHGLMGVHFGKESTDSIMKHIDSLSASARKIVRMEAVDRKREAAEAASVYSPNYSPSALELFAVDRDFNSEEDALAWLGGVVDYDTFSKAVN
ncbi:MAG: hypothetical protein E7422_08240 [Ruminococcaceae bacterium]|nr:hypothetical protein [Oscillospiraceae bacterium]